MEIREERKTVTVVFADLVGSTSLAERLDPEEVRLIVGDAVARIVHSVEEFGGTVKDLAGDGVLAFFGAPAAHEDDPERALRAARRIVQEMAAYGNEVERGWGIDGFSVRVGVVTGPVVTGALGAGARVEFAAFGDAVNTAARLQAAARPGTILVASSTQQLCAPLFSWGEPRELSLKGKSEAVVAYELGSPLAVSGKVRGLPGVHTPLVGRDNELEAARAALEDVRSGRGGILLLAGEAGIGKSRLMAEVRSLFETGGAPTSSAPGIWLEGRCVSYGESLTYWPYRDLLRDWLGVGADEPELRVRVALRRTVDRLFADRAGEIYPYLGAVLGIALEPEAAARLAGLSPEALQYRTFEVVGMLFQRLALDRPLVVAVDDLHWADATSIQLTEQLLDLTEEAAVLLLIALRPERDHPAWAVKELAAREFAHRTREVSLEALSGGGGRELLEALVGSGTLPEEIERRVLSDAEGNPFYLEELVGSLVDAGALVQTEGGWRFDHAVDVEIPETIGKVILSRIDRLTPECRGVLTSASVLGRRFGLPLLEGLTGGDRKLHDSLRELERLDLLREGRRWPQPEYRFKHALIQEAAYRTILKEERTSLHRRAAEWLEGHHAGNEEEAYGLLAHHWLAASDEEKAVAYLTLAGDKARLEYALDEAIGHYRALLPLLESRGARQAIALVLFKLALALHTSLRFAEANDAYQRAFEHWTPPPAWAGAPSATLRVATSFVPNDPDPKSAIAWPNIQLCMQLFDRLVEAWPERTIVPSLAERWDISDDGLRYRFHLRGGLTWSDGVPLTAHDVEYGIKRVLDPASPGSSVAIYFVLENAQDYYLGHHSDADRIGVRALGDRTVEFRLVAPAPYFMSVMNRPDSGPQPRHAIERNGEEWTRPGKQVVSGPFSQAERSEDRLVLVRHEGLAGRRPGNVGVVELQRMTIRDALGPYDRDEIDAIAVRYTPRLADLMPSVGPDAVMGLAGWSFYIAFDHGNQVVSDVEFRRALAHGIDRERLGSILPPNLVVATGGIVPPALQGHTPDIALRFDPDRARSHFDRAGSPSAIAVAALEDWVPMVKQIADSWKEVLGLETEIRSWNTTAAAAGTNVRELAPVVLAGWLPGYPDPEYFLRLLLHSDSLTNEGGFSHPPFDELIERARQERSDRNRLELFHQADRMAVADRVALIPLAYGRSMAFVKPWVSGWWEFGKSSSPFADLVVGPRSPRA